MPRVCASAWREASVDACSCKLLHHEGVHLLRAHDDPARLPIERVEASLQLAKGDGPVALVVRYRLTGDLPQLALPPRGPGGRVDGLWRHTCFEFFVRPRGSAGYSEVNLAPSTAWAAYAFDAYRAGMRPIEPLSPQIDVESSPRLLTLAAVFPLATLVDETVAACDAALAAVIEARDGSLSYWALAHPDPLRPDFHHPESFVHEIRH